MCHCGALKTKTKQVTDKKKSGHYTLNYVILFMKHNLRHTCCEFRDAVFARPGHDPKYPKFCPTVVALLCLTFIVWPCFWRVTQPVFLASPTPPRLSANFPFKAPLSHSKKIIKQTLTSKLSHLISNQGNRRHAGCVVWVFIPHLFGLPNRILENPSTGALIGPHCLEELGEEFLSYYIFFNAPTLSRHVHAI